MGKLILLIVVVVALIAIFGETRTKTVLPAATPPSPEKAAKKNAEEAKFQQHVAAVRRIKSSMKNPASFTLEDAIETPEGALCLVYRATNSFNAIVPGQAIVYRGQIVTSDMGDEFRGRWNARCFKKRGEDMKHIRQAL